MKIANMCKFFLRGVQFNGSSGSSDGVGTRMMSLWLVSWTVCIVPNKSTRWVVPGRMESSMSSFGVAIFGYSSV